MPANLWRAENSEMWRSLFLALGVSCCLLGGECLVIDKAVLKARHESPNGFLNRLDPNAQRRREIIAADWAPWSLLSAGAVTMLYSFTIPQRVKKE